MPANGVASDPIDLAVVGGGAAGTFVASQVQAARPDWSVALFERTDRIGGRLRSMAVDGLAHKIELGGMRFLTSHRRVQDVVTRFDVPTHQFDPTDGAERSFLRGRFGSGAGDPILCEGYDLPPSQRGRSALDLGMAAFETIVPGARDLDPDGWRTVRAGHRYQGRPLTAWPMGDALTSVLGPEGYCYVADSFGYDSGLRPFNVADAIEYLLGGGDPSARAVTPDDGMDTIPRALAGAFESAGGTIRLGSELARIEIADGLPRLVFADGTSVAARRVALTVAIPALQLLVDASPGLASPALQRGLAAVEAFPASKLYLWYDRPWWRGTIPAIRLTTDLPPRKVFYFDTGPDEPAALLAQYTDGRHTEPWFDLAAGSGTCSPAPAAVLEAAESFLGAIHPEVPDRPKPAGSALSLWGSDPHETGWTFWRAGDVSDEVIREIVRPVPGLDLFVCGEAFSRAQAWVEGALESAERTVDSIVARG
jgi:monoamine oxidase